MHISQCNLLNVFNLSKIKITSLPTLYLYDTNQENYRRQMDTGGDITNYISRFMQYLDKSFRKSIYGNGMAER